MTPKKKARKAIKAKVRDIISTVGQPYAKSGGANQCSLAGWVNYFRVVMQVAHSAKCATTRDEGA